MFDLFDLYSSRVYVVSDKMYDEYLQKQKDRKVAELDRSIQYYQDRLAELEKKKAELLT